MINKMNNYKEIISVKFKFSIIFYLWIKIFSYQTKILYFSVCKFAQFPTIMSLLYKWTHETEFMCIGCKPFNRKFFELTFM